MGSIDPPDLDWRSNEIIRAIADHGGQANTTEIRELTGIDNNDHVLYRLREKLAPNGLVDLHQPEAQSQRNLPKEAKLTQAGSDLAAQLEDEDSAQTPETESDRLTQLETRITQLETQREGESTSTGQGSSDEPDDEPQLTRWTPYQVAELSVTHISEVLTFQSDVSGTMAFRSANKGVSVEQAETTLAAIAKTLGFRTTEGSFTVNQSGVAWTGTGLVNFIETLGNQSTRYEELRQTDWFEPHSSEAAVYINTREPRYGISTGVRTLIAFGQPRVQQDSMTRFGVCLLSDGVPLNLSDLATLSDRVDLRLGNGLEIDLCRMEIPDEQLADVPVEIRRTVTTTRPGGTKETTGIIYENPFFDDEAAVTDYLDLTTGEDWWRHTVVSYLTGYRHLYSETRSLAPDATFENDDYQLTRFALSGFPSPADPSGFSHVNLSSKYAVR